MFKHVISGMFDIYIYFTLSTLINEVEYACSVGIPC